LQTIDDTGVDSMISYESPVSNITTYSAEGGSLKMAFLDKNV